MTVEGVVVEVVERRSLKLRVRLLRAKLLRALRVRSVVVVVEAEAQLVKLKSRSESGVLKENSSMSIFSLICNFKVVL